MRTVKAKNTPADELWGVELWGKALAARWRTIVDGKGSKVTSYEFDDLPDSLKVGEFPCALSYIFSDPMDIDYSQGGDNPVIWRGQTEFHLTANLEKRSLRSVYPFYRLIAVAAAGTYSLNGIVEGFQLRYIKSIQLSTLQYGDEAEHYGLIAYWEVFETISGKITVGN